MKNMSKKLTFFDISATFKMTFHFCFVVALSCKSKLSIKPLESWGQPLRQTINFALQISNTLKNPALKYF